MLQNVAHLGSIFELGSELGLQYHVLDLLLLKKKLLDLLLQVLDISSDALDLLVVFLNDSEDLVDPLLFVLNLQKHQVGCRGKL